MCIKASDGWGWQGQGWTGPRWQHGEGVTRPPIEIFHCQIENGSGRLIALFECCCFLHGVETKAASDPGDADLGIKCLEILILLQQMRIMNVT